jgi:hypothetical protein
MHEFETLTHNRERPLTQEGFDFNSMRIWDPVYDVVHYGHQDFLSFDNTSQQCRKMLHNVESRN